MSSDLAIGSAINSANDLTNSAGGILAQKQQNKDNIMFWHMQNAYNDPRAQINRLTSAGLSPQLVYGGSPGQVSGTAGPPPKIEHKSHKSSTIDPMMLIQADKIRAETDNIQKQSKFIEEKTIGQTRENLALGFQADLKSLGLDEALETYDDRVNQSQFRSKQAAMEYTMRGKDMKIQEQKLKQALHETTIGSNKAAAAHREEQNRKLGISPDAPFILTAAAEMYRSHTSPPYTAEGFKNYYKSNYRRITEKVNQSINNFFLKP